MSDLCRHCCDPRIRRQQHCRFARTVPSKGSISRSSSPGPLWWPREQNEDSVILEKGGWLRTFKATKKGYYYGRDPFVSLSKKNITLRERRAAANTPFVARALSLRWISQVDLFRRGVIMQAGAEHTSFSTSITATLAAQTTQSKVWMSWYINIHTGHALLTIRSTSNRPEWHPHRHHRLHSSSKPTHHPQPSLDHSSAPHKTNTGTYA